MKKQKKKTVIAYAHTHWDREWYREFEEFRTRLIEVFDDVIQKLEANELPSFYFDGQTSALEDYLEIKPQKKPLIEKLIKEKRLFIGPYYCSTDSFLVDAESIIKNLQTGLKYSKDFSCSDFIAYHADTFGHSAHLPNIIKYFNLKNAIFWRGLGELESEFVFNGVNSTYLIEGYFHDYFCAPVSIEKKAEFLKRTLDRIAKYSQGTILLPLGADHMAVADDLAKQIKEVNNYLYDYEIILSTPFEYLKKVENNYKKQVNHEFRDTKRNFILPGVLSSRIDIKQQNARLQWEISRITQPLQAICTYLKLTKSFQQQVDHAHKLLIQNHAHDSIYGCGIDAIHEENLHRYKQVSQILSSIKNSIRRDLETEKSISVMNLSNYDFNGAVAIKSDKRLDKRFNAQLIGKAKGFPLQKLYNIHQVPITEDYTTIYEYLIDLKNVNAFSTKCITDSDINTKSTLKITKNSIENDKISLFVENGKIKIKDKVKNKVYSDFIKFKDRADIGDSYNFGALSKDIPIYAKIVKTEIAQKGNIQCALNIILEINIPKTSTAKGRSAKATKHRFKLTAILENQNKHIEFLLNWQNKSCNHILQAEFTLPKHITETISDDLTGCTKRSFDCNYDIYKHIPAPRGIELKTNTAPLQKSVFAQGIGLITEGLQEYEVFQNKLSLTLLRATGTISNPKNPTRGTPAGPPLSTPDLQMLKENNARFALCFEDKFEELSPTTEKFFKTQQAFWADLNTTNIIKTDNKNIEVSTIKLNNQKNLVIRFLNKSDCVQQAKIETGMSHAKIYETDAMENEIKKVCQNGFILKFEPNSFKTIVVE